MAEDYIVKVGDCLNSIAYEHGFYWETLWSHPANAGLKAKRKSPDVLLAGDVVHIPDKQPKKLSLPTGKQHHFLVRGVPAMLRLRVIEPVAAAPLPEAKASTGSTGSEAGGVGNLLGAVSATDALKGAASSLPGGGTAKDVVTEDPHYAPVQMEIMPSAHIPYKLIVDEVEMSGSADGDGQILRPIAPNARSATLVLEPGTPRERTIQVRLGALDPAGGIGGWRTSAMNAEIAPTSRRPTLRVRSSRSNRAMA